MAILRSGATADELTIDPTSNAARATGYDSAGTELLPPPTGVYMLPFGIRYSAALAAAGKVWAMRNGSTKTVYITRIQLSASFDGTGAATTVIYQFMRFSTATPTGGNAQTVIKKNSSYPASAIADARLTTGAALLTVTSVVFESPFADLGCQHQIGGNSILDLNFGEHPSRCFVLGANEGLAINLLTATVIGDAMSGVIEWYEL